MKYCFFLLTALLFFFSCTTKEDKAREFVEQEVVQQAENYLIRQSILKYVTEEAIEVFKERYNYYAQHPDYDFSYIEKEMSRLAMAFASAYGGINKIFDERREKFTEMYAMLSCEENIEYGLHQIDSVLSLRDLTKETSAYTIEDIADIYFKPNHLKFTEITPELYKKIYCSMLCLGARTFKYDVVDDIRIRAKEDNKWNVDLVYHSGYCMPLEITLNKENRFFVSEAPWLSKSEGDADCITMDNYAKKMSFEEAIKSLYLVNGITADPKKYKNYEESVKGRCDEDCEFEFNSIDCYRLFLSNDAECNQGEEPFKTFICKILSSETFFKSRISLTANELEYFDIKQIPTFRFYMDINLHYSDSKIIGYEKVGSSWVYLTKDAASYVIYAGMDIVESYDFIREDGKWYLKGFRNTEIMENEMYM